MARRSEGVASSPPYQASSADAPRGPIWVEIDLAALRSNLQAVARACPPDTKIIAVTKANAYGHGAEAVSKAALEAGAWGVAVAQVREGVRLRRSGIIRPILVLGYATPDELRIAIEHELTMEISGWQTLLTLSSIASSTGKVATVHLKVDTGMRRYGVAIQEAAQFVEAARGLPAIDLQGLYTHFATADEPGSTAFRSQLQQFRDLLSHLESRHLRPRVVHAANSAAALSHPEACFDAIRLGIALYGIRPWPGCDLDLLPVMSVKATVGRVLDVCAGDGVSYGHTYIASSAHRAAVVTCGYADGYHRSLSNKGEMLIGGRRCPVIGRVCMDSTIVRLPEDAKVAVGEEAVILGKQGADEITADELAESADTIPYEILCSMGRRSVRVYKY